MSRRNILLDNRQISIEELQRAIRTKLNRIEKLNRDINKLKYLFEERDRLIEEILPLFVSRNPDGSITIVREVRVGNRVYKLTPAFFDNKKNKFIATQWKSTAFQNFWIE